MDDFGKQLQYWVLKVNRLREDAFVRAAQLVHESIQTGSPVTGAPGQPVDTANLRDSWQLEFDGPDTALISTNVAYAPPIEDGIGPHGPLTLRSEVGGFHSVKLTRAGWQKLVDQAVLEMAGG